MIRIDPIILFYLKTINRTGNLHLLWDCQSAHYKYESLLHRAVLNCHSPHPVSRMNTPHFHDSLRLHDRDVFANGDFPWQADGFLLTHYLDLKSTRLNSSHVAIAYAVF